MIYAKILMFSMNKFSFRFVSGVEAIHTLKAEPIPNFFKGDFVVVASCIFRHMGVGVVTSGIIQMLPKSIRDEYSPFIMSAGIITQILMFIPELAKLVDMILRLFRLG